MPTLFVIAGIKPANGETNNKKPSIGNLHIFPLILPTDIVSINKLTPKLNVICQCDINYIMILQIETIMSV